MVPDFLVGFLIAALVTLLSIPLVRKLAFKYDLVDDPSRRPHPAHIHTKIIPRAGGLAIFAGILVACFFTIPFDKHLLGILIGSSFLLIMGLLDDRLTNFSPYARLGLLFLAAAAPVGAGIGISFITNPFYHLLPFMDQQFIILTSISIPIELFGPHRIIFWADLVAFLWIVTLTQVVNWAKGVDGQMPGITFMTAITLGFLSLRFFNQGDISQYPVAVLSFIVAGAALGFLICNWHPAKILPGFSGSTILAFMIATLSILSGAKLATAILVLAIPTADFVYTIFRRVAKGKSPVWGDRGHLHHKLLDRGWSVQTIALFYISISAILGLAALQLDSQGKLFTLLGVAIIFIALILWLNSFGGLSKPHDPDNG
jgi:UDP-GlcNAc:undecaprenyl-phosphate GlcNAc-1-phosphate transferase